MWYYFQYLGSPCLTLCFTTMCCYWALFLNFGLVGVRHFALDDVIWNSCCLSYSFLCSHVPWLVFNLIPFDQNKIGALVLIRIIFLMAMKVFDIQTKKVACWIEMYQFCTHPNLNEKHVGKYCMWPNSNTYFWSLYGWLPSCTWLALHKVILVLNWGLWCVKETAILTTTLHVI